MMSGRPSLPSHRVLQNLLSFAGEQLHEGWPHFSCCLSDMNDLGQFPSAFRANDCFDIATSGFAGTWPWLHLRKRKGLAECD
jgi:hypothetical protein